MFSILRRVLRSGRPRRSQVLLTDRATLIASFGARVEERPHRPDLYPEQLVFDIEGGCAQAAILDDRCHHAMLLFTDSVSPPSLLDGLARCSGTDGWARLEHDDPLVHEHFPAFNPSGAKNAFYASGDRSAVALAQAGTPLAPLVVWLQSSEYPVRLAAYRVGKAQ